MKNPCYDEATKTGCPKRCGGCSVNCPKWAEYCKERNERYDKNLEETKVMRSIYESRYCNQSAYRKERVRKRHKMF